jgi:SAM-dependent methyltransferase
VNDTLYSLPLYYDIAFSWDLEPELGVFDKIFAKHVPGAVSRILEPACGTGRFLITLPKRGYRVTGYDTSPEMLEYARGRVEEAGFARGAEGASGDGDPSGWAEVIEADMVYAPIVPDGYDAALNSINSLGYLLTDREIVAHFRRTGFSLRPGGIYIAHLSCAHDGEPSSEGEIWEFERDGVRVKTTWSLFCEDLKARRSFQSWEMVVHDRGRVMRFWDSHVFRLWTLEDIERLAARSGVFELDAVYTERFEEVPAGTRITGEMGNLYFILKSVRHRLPGQQGRRTP